MDRIFRRTPDFHLQDIISRLLDGDRISLGRAITLVESKHPGDKKVASELIDAVLPHSGKSFRLGITGVPGVGKSTFIESFGKFLTHQNKKVAVLSIDPSSSKTKGSILGDKTRMVQLSTDPNAYIRPTASGKTPGGVGSNTRDAILLCEAAGFDCIIVETVGVGQGETVVKDMVDYFLLLMLAGGGDELQGMKRGIMEMADHIVINKAEKDNAKQAQKAAKNYESAVHLFSPNEAEWVVPVSLCSALEKTGIEEIWNWMNKFIDQTKRSGWLEENRKNQTLRWYHERIKSRLETDFYSNENIRKHIANGEKQVRAKTISVRKAVDDLFQIRPTS